MHARLGMMRAPSQPLWPSMISNVPDMVRLYLMCVAAVSEAGYLARAAFRWDLSADKESDV